MIEQGRFLQQRYRIDKQIGQGGMGAVYVATDERFNSTVAIKETLCMDDNFRKAIEREARLLNSLKHSALPRVSDHFLEDEGQFLVMEFIQGEDLHVILEREKKGFPVETVMTWAGQLLDALDYLHNQDNPVIHRDIKPQNLKINSHGQIILLDFGLAKGNPTDAAHNTAAKSIFGYSRNYASLEQIQGTGTDPRSDLYSLAATLYHLLTNRPPDDALTRAMSVLSKQPDPLMPANLVDTAVPQGIAGVLHNALDLNANERPSSAAEMKEMLAQSDDYAYLADTGAIQMSPSDPRVFSEPTKLMGDGTHAAAVKQTDIKTEVMPEYVSTDTSVRPRDADIRATFAMDGNTRASVHWRRGFSMAAGALLMLLFGGAIAGGLYYFEPSIFGTHMDIADKETASPPANTDPGGDIKVSSVQVDPPELSADSNTASVDTARQTTTAAKQAETTRDTRSPVADKAKAQVGGDNIVDFTADDPDIPPGGVVITQRDENGKITTMRVNRSAGQQKVHPIPLEPDEPFAPGFDPGKMTPAQREKLRRAIKKAMNQPANIPPDQP